MIRDGLVVGLLDDALSEKLQLNADLTLETRGRHTNTLCTSIYDRG